MMKFNERLKAIIKFKELQQKDFAKEIKISESMVSRWLKGISMPRVKHLEKISKFLNVSVSALLGQEELLDRLLERYESELIA